MSLIIDESAIKRIQNLRTQRNAPALRLRITVDGGGCSGFQYLLDLAEDSKDGDLLYGADCVVTDPVSLPFLEGARITFVEDLIGSEFKITNPNAVSGCGCGTSFAV